MWTDGKLPPAQQWEYGLRMARDSGRGMTDWSAWGAEPSLDGGSPILRLSVNYAEVGIYQLRRYNRRLSGRGLIEGTA